ncbi:Protein of uncharacterised function (DUF3151) [Dermatophilus congolensis]|uniref:Protein of uncharacterized function (DUF3151) n=1 Tax=Dermatophilus congolensis TaxID=1863 RepID=A0AA46GZY1_9MICO|nr:DUF3151 domain-containing protein [Dermatophilus congolensis]STD06253.1 Protein of uncharacterised function (DUF3151) [Dermatophilus congolensis]
MGEHEVRKNLLGPEPTLLPVDSSVERLVAGEDAQVVAAADPLCLAAWAALAEQSLACGEFVQAYAFARVGYHRGLDALRRAGWRGTGPVPWSHEPNRGFLRSLAALALAASALGEGDEEQRCRVFLRDSSAEAAQALGL